jgi:hypothetical protein
MLKHQTMYTFNIHTIINARANAKNTVYDFCKSTYNNPKFSVDKTLYPKFINFYMHINHIVADTKK